MRDTIPDLIDRHVTERPDDVGLVYEGRSYYYSKLALASRRAAQGFAELGIARGDRVAMWLPNCPAYVVAVLGLARLGAIASAVNTRFRSHEVGDLIERSGARALVMWPEFRGIDFLGILGGIEPAMLKGLESLVLYDEGETAGETPSALAHCRSVHWVEIESASPFEGDHAAPDLGSNTFTTSGTTSKPKFVLHTHASIARHARTVAAEFELDRGGLLQALPFCGVFGFCQLTAGLAAGRPLIVTSAFDAAEAARLIDEHAVETLFATDGMVASWLDLGNDTPVFPSVKKCYYALFDPALEDLPARARERGLELYGLYGMSEVQAFFSRQPSSQTFARRIRGGGVPISTEALFRVRDPESGEILAPGEQGELELRGASMMKEYFGNPAATREAFTEDGYLRSGDMGTTTDDGGFVFLSRMGDVLRLGGFLVAPAEIEACLATHVSVDGSQVVDVTTPEGPRAVGFVTLAAGAELDEDLLREHCRAGLARFKVPSRVFAVDEFPTTLSANGTKIQRTRLRDMAQAAIETGSLAATEGACT
ncbi:MAG: AMP-binding protein [Acidobacteriota bacterium]|nr:AMP-binding protein [Acidobacteriota bacterium]